jgi:predicted P-loop ATPase
LYHPVRDYLDSLAWDGQPHITKLAEHFVDKHGVFGIYLRRWLIGAVARVYIKTQNPMLVMDGKQGIGKSYFARWLVNDLNNFNEGMIQPENKDDQVRLLTTWIWEVKELGATLRKSDMEALKSFLTLESVRVRKPYGHYDIVKQAITSFIGTINNIEGFLADPTGSRRFNITPILSINWAYKDAIDRDQVWAEARAAYLAREPWMLTSDEQKIHDEINEEYAITDPVEDALLVYFDIDPNEKTWWTATSEIVRTLEDPVNGAALHMGSSRTTAMAVARALLKIGCKKVEKQTKSGQHIRGYIGIKPKGLIP